MTDPKNHQSITFEQFEQRLNGGDRWIEVNRGRFMRLQPPDDAHGDVVRNLSWALASHFKKSPDAYACFELPLVLDREPPTVRCPAVSCFQTETAGRFAEMDKAFSETRPLLVIEVASTNDRREAMSDRIRSYLDWGVREVWVIDPVTRHVHRIDDQQPGRMLKETEILLGQPLLSGFSMLVSNLFQPPPWMTAAKPRNS